MIKPKFTDVNRRVAKLETGVGLRAGRLVWFNHRGECFVHWDGAPIEPLSNHARSTLHWEEDLLVDNRDPRGDD